MRTLLFLFGLFAVAFGFNPEQHAIAARAIGFTLEDAQRMHVTSQNLPGFELQDTITDCNNSINAAAAQAAQCGVFAIFNPNNTYTHDQLLTMVQAHCVTGGCKDALQTALADVITQCTPIFTTGGVSAQVLWYSVGFYMLINAVPCIQEDTVNGNGEYCFVTFKEMQTRLMMTDGLGNQIPLNDTELTHYCTQCLVDIAAFWLTFDKRGEALYGVATLHLICLQIDGNWCQQDFMQFVLDAQTAGDSFVDVLLANPDPYCKPCTLAALNAYKLIAYLSIFWGPDGSSDIHRTSADFLNIVILQNMMGFMCTKTDGVYCVQKVNYSDPNIQAAFAATVITCLTYDPVVNPACNNDAAKQCKQLVNGVKQLGGCCVTDLLAFTNSVCPLFVYLGQTPPDICGINSVDYIFGNPNCGVSTADRCGANVFLELKLLVDNARIDWCLANLDACYTLVKNAIATYSGLDDNSLNNTVVVGVPQDAATDPTVTRRLLDFSGTGVVVSLKFPSTTGSFIITKPNGTVTDAQVDAVSDYNNPVQITTLQSTVSNGATAVLPSFMLLMLLVAALLL
jgi:hypothetical protein